MHKENGEEYLSFITAKLQERIRSLGVSIEETQKDIESMHEYYWENYTEMDQYGYENFDNQQALFNQITANEDARHLVRRFRRMLDSPFFGRVDFRYENEEGPEIFYIGIGNFAEEAGQVPLIFDWRAPVSGLFYDYDKGEASYEAPAGIISGEILSRWQYKIRGGRMVYAFESDVKIDDEVLKSELGSGGSDRLRNIIRTIQKEQNAIIRNTKDRIMVIQGAAGSGKTSIALHRIAYLLYHDRKNLKSSNILILSPNGIFADYISHILPELGEENIREMTLDLYAYRQLKEICLDCEDRYDALERELSGLVLREESARAAYKQSREYVNRLEGFMIRLEDELMNFAPVEYKGFSFSEEEILDLFYNRFSEFPLLTRMEEVAERFIDEWETLRSAQLPDPDRELLLEEFRSMYETRDLYVIYNRFLKIEQLPLLEDLPVQERIIPYEDVYPLLYLKIRLSQFRPDARIRHLIVDEMQDYSWLQFAILQRLFSCRMTILGDRAQTMDARQSDAMKFLPEIFGRDIRRIVMNKCYRNTVPIASWANRLAGITDMELVEREGAPVREERFGTLKEALDEAAEDLAEKPSFETAALITLTREDAGQAYQYLKEVLERRGYDTRNRLNHLHRDSSSFSRGLTVTTFYLAKGLEFERVYMVFPKEDPASEARRALLVQAGYIAATRAMHELSVFYYG